MHEIGIANEIIRAGQVEVTLRPGSTLCRIGIRIGVLAGVDIDALNFAFQALTQGTELSNVDFDVQICPRRNRCLACSTEFESAMYCEPCPKCASPDAMLIGGSELDLSYVEVEEA
jgi:hydrogenase nickel incorporation protein HypA/HybF